MKVGRRGFLMGVGGAIVALPVLEGIGPVSSAAAGPDDRRRFAIFVRSGNGVQQAWDAEPERFWPREVGALTTAGLMEQNSDRAISELSSFASRLNVLKGVNRPFSTPACGHAESIPQCLTAQRTSGGSSNEPLALGQSADWLIANQLNPDGAEPLTLMAGPDRPFIGEALSWRAANDRTPAERSPANVYTRLMGLSGMPPEIQERIRNRRLSVNDLVREEMSTLMSSSALSARDHDRLEQHFNTIREMELDVMCNLAPATVDDILSIGDPRGNDVRPQVVRQHMNLIAFAISCGQTRAATLQIGEGNDQTQYELDGSRLPRFHWVSHRIYSDGSEGETIPNADVLHHGIDRIQLGLFNHLLTALDGYDSAYGGSLLDDGVAVWLNDLGSGPPHSGQNVPWILAGSAGGCLRTGNYLDLGGVTIDRVLNTIVTAVGCTNADGGPVEDFGDASLAGGRLTEIAV